jgi:hypothetical protein
LPFTVPNMRIRIMTTPTHRIEVNPDVMLSRVASVAAPGLPVDNASGIRP